MTHNEGSASAAPSQADFVGMLALVLIAIAVLSPIVILIAAMTTGS